MDQSLFMETQLGPGESALSCGTLLEKTRNRIYGQLIEAVSLLSLINPHLFLID